MPILIFAVILPISTKPKPRACIALGVTPFLSKPAAKPIGFGNVNPHNFFSNPKFSELYNVSTKALKKLESFAQDDILIAQS